MNHDVYDTTYENVGPLPERRTTSPSLAQDVGPKQIDEDVHFFVNPIIDDGIARSANAPAPSLVQRNNNKKDIGEKGVDEEVHGFVSAYTPPIQNRREEQPYAPNGSDPSSHVERKKKDIGEKGVDEEVHGFVSAFTPPLQNRREEQPYAPNGSDPSSHMQRKKKDIGEKGVDEEVHGFVSAYTPPLQNRREEQPYAPNGSDPSSHIQKSAEAKDIANKEIRPDVWKTVYDIVGPTNGYTRASSPDEEDLQLEPERVHVLEPIAHQWRANTNLPGPRTTFYDKKNGMWRQELEM